MIDLIVFILYILGGSYLLTQENGMFNVISYFRENLPERINPLKCPYCSSFWLGLIYSFVVGKDFLVFPFSAVGVQLIYEKVIYFTEMRLLK